MTPSKNKKRIAALTALKDELVALGKEWDGMAAAIATEGREATSAEVERAKEIRDREIAIKRAGLKHGVQW